MEAVHVGAAMTAGIVLAHSMYTLVREGGRSVLKAESLSSASGLVCRRTFNI